MNCPRCDMPLDENGICPSCEAPEEVPASLPGIYYETLEESRREDPVPKRRQKEPFFSPGEKRAIGGCLLLLVLFVALVAFSAGKYDPDATALKGAHGITMDNEAFAVYYAMEVSNFLSSAETTYFDASAPLDKQYYNIDVGYTWDDYFKEQALSSAALTASLVYAADREGFTLSQAQQEALDQELAAMQEGAEASYGNADRYMAANMGAYVTWEGYCQYYRDSTLAQAYADSLYVSYNFSDDELSAYYDANSADYTSLKKSDLPNVDIRHILFAPETDSAEDDETAKTDAEDALRQCRSGGNDQIEEIFLSLVTEYSMDAGSKTNGGLLENIAPGEISNAVSDWCFAPEGRQAGDTAVLPSNYGYHVVYFLGYRDNYEWKDQVLADLRKETLGHYMQALLAETNCRLTRFAEAN